MVCSMYSTIYVKFKAVLRGTLSVLELGALGRARLGVLWGGLSVLRVGIG